MELSLKHGLAVLVAANWSVRGRLDYEMTRPGLALARFQNCSTELAGLEIGTAPHGGMPCAGIMLCSRTRVETHHRSLVPIYLATGVNDTGSSGNSTQCGDQYVW